MKILQINWFRMKRLKNSSAFSLNSPEKHSVALIMAEFFDLGNLTSMRYKAILAFNVVLNFQVNAVTNYW